MLPIKQEFRIDRKHLLAYFDVNTSFRPLVFVVLHSLLWFLLEHFTFGREGLFSPWVVRIVLLIPCAYLILRQVRVILSARRTLRFVFFEDKAIGYSAKGKTAYSSYRAVKRIRENETFLRIVSRHSSATLKKDDLSPEELEAVTAAIASGAPKGARKAKKGSGLLCASMSALVIAAVLLNCFGWLPSAMDRFAFSFDAGEAAFFRYSRTFRTENADAHYMYSYGADGDALVIIAHKNGGDTPPERYHVTRMCKLWDVWSFPIERGLWTICDATQEQIPLAFEAGNASVCVIAFDSFRVIEVSHLETKQCRIEAQHTPPKATVKQYDGKHDLTHWSYNGEEIPQDLILFIDDEAYPIGEMLAGR